MTLLLAASLPKPDMRAQFPFPPLLDHAQKLHVSESKHFWLQHFHDSVPGKTSAFSRARKFTFSFWQLYSRVSSDRVQPGSAVGSADGSCSSGAGSSGDSSSGAGSSDRHSVGRSPCMKQNLGLEVLVLTWTQSVRHSWGRERWARS